MFGFLGNLIGSAASYVTGGHPAPQPDDQGGEWPDAPEEAERKRRQGLIQNRARAQQGKMPPGMQAPAQQQQQAQQPQQGQWQGQQAQGNPSVAQAHFGHQNGMISGVNNAIQNEMNSRVQQASEERDRQHQYAIESMRQQGAMARQQQTQQQPQQDDGARQRRNAALMKMAGMGGHTVVNGKHYPLGALGRSLMG